MRYIMIVTGSLAIGMLLGLKLAKRINQPTAQPAGGDAPTAPPSGANPNPPPLLPASSRPRASMARDTDSGGAGLVKAAFYSIVGAGIIYVGYKLVKPIADVLDGIGDLVTGATEAVRNVTHAAGQLPTAVTNMFTIWFADCSWHPHPSWLNMATSINEPISQGGRAPLTLGGSFGTGVPRGLEAAFATWGVTAAASKWTASQTINAVRMNAADAEMKQAIGVTVTHSGGSYTEAAQRIYHQTGVLFNCGKIPPTDAQYAANTVNELLVNRFKRLFSATVVLKSIGNTT